MTEEVKHAYRTKRGWALVRYHKAVKTQRQKHLDAGRSKALSLELARRDIRKMGFDRRLFARLLRKEEKYGPTRRRTQLTLSLVELTNKFLKLAQAPYRARIGEDETIEYESE